jgi:hypothetical protein
MGEGYNFEVLRAEILKRSRATEWETARKEWALIDIYDSSENETCLCGHYPIREICIIRNKITAETTEVGNVCVKRFLGIRSDLIFKALKRIKKNPGRSLNADAIVFFYRARAFNDWEYNFLQNTKAIRILSAAQLRTRLELNRRVLDAVARRGLQAYSA